MRIAKYIIVFLLLSTPAFGATHWVDPAGSGTTCSEGSPCTIEYAIETKASSGDTVKAKDGSGVNAYATDQLNFPVGVSLVSDSVDKTAVVIQPDRNMAVGTPLIKLSSVDPGTTGNQSISYVTIDGTSGSYTARQGIEIKNRDNVSIHHCTIEDFTGVATTSKSSSSWGLHVYSSETDEGAINWWDMITTDFVKSGSYPANPVDNFQFYNNAMDDCGHDAGTDRAQSPSIWPWHIANSSFYDNKIDGSHAAIKPVHNTPGLWDNVDFYDNIIICHTDGILANSKTMWALEIWVMFDCETYNNKVINGGFSITVGKGNKIYYNYVDKSGTTNGQSYGIEATWTDDVEIHHNYLKGNSSSGTMWGIDVGTPTDSAADNSTMDAYIHNNILQDIRVHGIFLDQTESTDGQTLNAYIFNNTIDNLDSYPTWDSSAIRYYLNNSGSSATIHVKNNIIINNHLGYWTKDLAPTLVTSNNLWDSNTTDSIPSSVYDDDTDKVITTPSFTNYPTDLTASLGGSQVDSGIPISDINGVSFKNGLSSTTVWGSGQTLPVVATLDQSLNGSGWEIGAYVYSDAPPPQPGTSGVARRLVGGGPNKVIGGGPNKIIGY